MTKPDAMQSPRIFPTFRCNDPDTVIAWLCDVVGFAERVVYRSGGHVVHAELAYGSSIIMLGRHREDGYGQLVGDPAGRRTDAIYIAVDDADALFARIKASGVTIEPSRTTPTMAAATFPAGTRTAICGRSAPTGRRSGKSR